MAKTSIQTPPALRPVHQKQPEKTDYISAYHCLKSLSRTLLPSKQIQFQGVGIEKIPFHSNHTGPTSSVQNGLNRSFEALLKFYLSQNHYSNDYIFRSLQIPDTDIFENQNFHPILIKPAQTESVQHLIILLHGLNEKTWDKYLPWAYSLSQQTQAAVLLFPTAFHMDRVPAAWSDPKLMHHAAKERQILFPEVTHASFANVAISHRLQFAPERFLLSGLQTYHDILSLTWQIRCGQFPRIAQDAVIDFLAYSMGAFLGEILLMANPSQLFDASKLLMFCGGATLNLTNPVSKMILDSEAAESLFGYLDSFRQNSKFHTTSEALPLESAPFFEALLHDSHQAEFRNNRFTELGRRVLAVALAGDTVIPAKAIEQTLHAEKNVITLNFDHPYTHETPFPVQEKYRNEVNKSFNLFMTIASDFFQA